MFQTLPKIFILYGPPAAGKGTQAFYLNSLLPDYYHLDFGTELRKFTNKILGHYFDPKMQKINPSASEQELLVAKNLQAKLKNFQPVNIEDLKYVIEKNIKDNLVANKGMIIEGPGRKEEEAEWLSQVFKDFQLNVAIFHLHISLSETVKRSATRYYVPGIEQPFESYQKAKEVCQDGQEPYRRPEDDDSIGITQRYELLYSDIFAKIISIYQLKAGAQVLTVDASLTKEQVSKQIKTYLETFFNYHYQNN